MQWSKVPENKVALTINLTHSSILLNAPLRQSLNYALQNMQSAMQALIS